MTTALLDDTRPELMTLREAAHEMRCHEQTLLRNQGRPNVPVAFKSGGRWLVRRDSVLGLLHGHA